MRIGSGDGIRVEASVLARLLGLKLLKVDATVLVFPTEVVAPPTALVTSGTERAVRDAGASRDGPSQRPAGRRTLAEAVRSINEGAELLAESKRGGSPARTP